MFADSLCVSEIGAGDVQHDLDGAEEAPDVKERRAPAVDTPEDVQRPVAPAADKRKQGNPVAADPDADRVVDKARDRVDDVCVEEGAARRDKCVGAVKKGSSAATVAKRCTKASVVPSTATSGIASSSARSTRLCCMMCAFMEAGRVP